MNLFKKSASDNHIFRNEEAFQPDYLPDELLHRESELQEIVFAVKALEDKRRQPSTVIFGPPGTGKTCASKFVVKEFCEYSQRAIPVYVNCWQNGTRYAILSKIAQSVDALVPSTGITIEEMFSRMRESLAESGKIPLIILDEVDIIQKNNEEEVLYDLLRAEETYGIQIGLILITNDVYFVSKLDKRIRSSLAQGSVEFCAYTPQELKDILKERAKIALLPGTYDEDVLSVCAGFSAKNGGDARLGISLLWLSAKQAEKHNSSKIELADVESAKSKITVGMGEHSLPSAKEKSLKQDENKLLEFIRLSGEVSSGELYSSVKINERTARNYLSHLESIGLIESEEKALKSGRTRVFRVKQNK